MEGVSFADFRSQVAPLLSLDRRRQLYADGVLRRAQFEFAERSHDISDSLSFAKICTGAGKTRCIVLVCLGIVAASQQHQRQHCKVLITAPSTAAKNNICKELRSQGFLTQLGLSAVQITEFHDRVYEYEGGTSAVALQKWARAWVIVSTIQRMFRVNEEMLEGLSELIVDEGDSGSMRTPSNAQRPAAWHKIVERVQALGSAVVLLLSATTNKHLPAPYYEYNYAAALADNIVKRLNVLWVVPAEVHFGGGDVVTDLSELTPVERQACEASLDCSRVLVNVALQQLLELRQGTGVPYLMHVLVHRAGDHIVAVTRMVEERSESLRCPVTSRPLTVDYACGSDAEHVLERFQSGNQLDVLVSCKLMGRAVDVPLLAVTLNLKRFSMESTASFEQCVIGRGIRVFAADRQLPQVAIVIESEANGNRALYSHFAEANAVALNEQQLLVPSVLIAETTPSLPLPAFTLSPPSSPLSPPPPIILLPSQPPTIAEIVSTPPSRPLKCNFSDQFTELTVQFHCGEFRLVNIAGTCNTNASGLIRELESRGITLGINAMRDLITFFSEHPRTNEWYTDTYVQLWHQQRGTHTPLLLHRDVISIHGLLGAREVSCRVLLLTGEVAMIHRRDAQYGPEFRLLSL